MVLNARPLAFALVCCLLAACGGTAAPNVTESTPAPSRPAAIRLAPTATTAPSAEGQLLGRIAAAETTAEAAPISAAARAYLDDALDYIQENSVVRDRIDWGELRRRALETTAGAQSPTDTYKAIRLALYELGDRHSHFLDPTQARTTEEGEPDPPMPQGRLLREGIGYVALPRLVAVSGEQTRRYALTAGRAIRRLDRAGASCWVVDLRGNGGGNMWPMIAAVGPILGEGEAGAFVSPGGERVPWSYRRGRALNGESVAATGMDLRLGESAPPVAVLTDGDTASSGEFVAISFRGRPNARSFGEPTSGVPTANDGKRLRDGAVILLTVALGADRTGRTYDGPIPPDQPVAAGADALDGAVAWLRTRPGCGR